MSGSADDKLSRALWDPARLSRAVPELLRHAGWGHGAGLGAPATPAEGDLKPWLDACAARFNADIETTELRHDRLSESLTRRTPLILRVSGSQERYLCVIAASRRTTRLLMPGGSVEVIPTGALVEALRAGLEAPIRARADRLTRHLTLSERRRRRLTAAYLRQAVGNQVAVEGWVLKPTPGAGFWHQLRHANLLRAGARFLSAQILEYVLWIASWLVLGRALLAGHAGPSILAAWVLVLATVLLARLASERLQSELGIGVGALIKSRLLDGVLHLDPDTTRGQGVGHLLGRTLDCESVEALAVSGGFATLTGCVQLVIAMAVLVGVGTGPWLPLELCGWGVMMAAAIGLLWRRRSRWVDLRLDLTHRLVESMVGYRTRVAQQRPERWHAGEDEAFAEYLHRSHTMDGMAALVLCAPRAWLMGSVLTLVITAGSVAASPIVFAGAIGAILLAYAAQRQLSAGASSIIDAAIAWQRVRALFDASGHAAKARSQAVAPDVARPSDRDEDDDSTASLRADAVSYRYSRHSTDTLTACSLTIRPGDRILLEGPSGAGKSTLVAVLAGLRPPHGGTLAASGRHLIPGQHDWRQRVVIAPQFHDNHVVADTFLFNLLMGRRWPPAEDDVVEAIEVCRELGLGPLIERMPGGLHQPVGDAGWQLSHGERSRLFVARALLQRAGVVIFDESFAALDPETLRTCLACVWKRAPAALLVAHP